MVSKRHSDELVLYAQIAAMGWACFLMGVLVLGAVTGNLDVGVAAIMVPALAGIIVAPQAVKRLVK